MHLNLRRLALGAAAFALAGGTSTVLIGALPASAASGPNGPTITCTFSATVTFAAPGLSAAGFLGPKITSTTTSSTPLACNDGTNNIGSTFPSVSIVTKSATKCKGKPTDAPLCLANAPGSKGLYVDGTTAGLATSGSSIVKAFKKVALTIGSYGGFSIKNSTAGEIVGTNGCSGVGFTISGAIKSPKTPSNYKGGTSNIVACLDADTGPGTTGNFTADLGGSATVVTATADGTLVLTS